ncbi:glycosyltransferase [Furfurilactobacillus sp. WILCCON 0119]
MKIATIMSTYNGEKYIQEQIDSIYNQDFSDSLDYMDVYVRDDGSSDRTLEILAKLQNKYSQLKIIKDDKGNLGVKRNFFQLLTMVSDYELVFFSDQDDIWPENKVTEFVTKYNQLNKSNEVIGLYSDAWVADKEGKPTDLKMSDVGHWKKESVEESYGFLMLTFRVTGAAFAINHRAVQMVNQLEAKQIRDVYMHDAFIAVLIASLGTLARIDMPLLYYRQHGNNLVGASNGAKTFKKRWQAAIKKANYTMSDGCSLYDYLTTYGAEYCDDQQMIVLKKYFTNYFVLKNSRRLSLTRIKAARRIASTLAYRSRRIMFGGLLSWINFHDGGTH